MRTLSRDSVGKIGEKITVKGWVNSRRDHGGLIFIDLRDHTGVLQLVISPESAEAFGLAEKCRDEFVLAVTGNVKERDESLKNDHIETGSVELVVEKLEILNRSEPLPIAAKIPFLRLAPTKNAKHVGSPGGILSRYSRFYA